LRYVKSLYAERDLEGIYRYTIRSWGKRRAAHYLGEIEKKFERLTDAPEIGAPCPELGDGVRRLSHGAHVIFYRIRSGAVEIIRILHGMRDIKHL